MGNDTLTIEILEDGTIRTLTDAVSAANHSNAEQFMRFLAEKTGGPSVRTRRREEVGHTHHHAHESAHGHTH